MYQILSVEHFYDVLPEQKSIVFFFGKKKICCVIICVITYQSDSLVIIPSEPEI